MISSGKNKENSKYPTRSFLYLSADFVVLVDNTKFPNFKEEINV